MKVQILVVVTAALAMTMAAPARADDASRLSIAHEVVDLMNVRQTVEDMFQQSSPMFAAQVGQEMHLSQPEQSRVGALFAEELHNSVPQLMDRVAAVYAQNVTEDQLTQIRDFLKTPAGHSMLATEGVMQQQLQHEGETIGIQVAGRVLQRFGAERQAGTIH